MTIGTRLTYHQIASFLATSTMEFEWEENKNQTNIRKHGVSFMDAINVFLDPYRIEREDDRLDYGEVRFQVIGMVSGYLRIGLNLLDDTSDLEIYFTL